MDIQSNTCKSINIDKKSHTDIIQLKNQYLTIKKKIYQEIITELDLKNTKVIPNK